MKLVFCNYCKGRAELVKGSALFPEAKDLYYKKFWRCDPCKAHVGCHPGTTNPLGTLAKSKLRRKRHLVHLEFKKKWMRGRHKKSRAKRKIAYAWLAGKLGTPAEKTNVGMFDEDMCSKALEVLKPNNKENAIDFGFVKYKPEKK
jgi:hypothetical protein